MANMEYVVKVAGAIHTLKRNNHIPLEIDFYGHKAIYWPKGATVVLRNPVDGKYMSLPAK